jgi:gamma-glutamyltranspeptidase/glutathione hydrolase
MSHSQSGVVAAGHPLSARAGAEVLRSGGNAVDAALAAMLAAMACEPLLTGLGAGGYMLVREADGSEVLLDFFVEAAGRAKRATDLEAACAEAPPGTGAAGAEAPPGTGAAGAEAPAELVPVAVSFGDAVQEFHIGVASAGCYGVPAGIAAASARFGTVPLAELAAPAADLAREGVALNRAQAYVIEILSAIVTSTPECERIFAPAGRVLGEGEMLRQPELADALELLGREGAEPFYTGPVARRVCTWVMERGGRLSGADLAAYRVIDREPVRVRYRGREVSTNPPPSAGGILIALALAMLEREPSPPPPQALVAVMERVQRRRTPEFLAGLGQPGFATGFLGAGPLGSTTHVSVIDGAGMACSVTCSNGSCSGVVVPGTGIHLNNMLGEQDLNPLGFHRHPPGRRLPSMMAPTIVAGASGPELVLGSAGSNRIRSAILQTIVRVLDEGLTAAEAVRSPRLHYEDGVVYAEPGIELAELRARGGRIAPFRALNLFFGGVQAVQRDPAGVFWGGGDPRRGGAAVVVQ